MSFGTETSFYSDLMSECKNQGTDPDTYGAMMVTNGSLRAAARCVCGIWTLFAENQ